MHRSRIVFIIALALAAAALLLPAGAFARSGMTYDQAVDDLYAKGYPQAVESYLDSLGTSPLGFRLGGTSADDEAARYLADQLRAAGYSDVRLEAVPVDEWDMRGASLTVGARTFTCSQFAGVPGTPDAGVAGGIVYVGNGTAAEYEGKDVAGKIVLVDSALDSFWLNLQGAEATKHGATAVLLTSNYSAGKKMTYPSYPWYSVAPDALGANDGEYDMSFVPLVYLSQQDGDWLKAQLAGGAVSGTLVSTVRITMADNGGEGYNVVATLKGTGRTKQMTIWNAHHDAHFRAGLDDTGAVAATLAAAKAMKDSGYRPRRTIVFVFDTAEEFGYTNAWYDWSIGAWYLITHTHPEWVGRIAAMYSIELMAAAKAPVDINTSPELKPWLDKVLSSNRKLAPYGYKVTTPQSTWQNGWSFMASGVPSFEISAGGPGYDEMYHSTYEDQTKVDWNLTAKMSKLFLRINSFADQKQLPYDFTGRVNDLLKGHFSAKELVGAGAGKPQVDKLQAAAKHFRSVAAQFKASAKSIKGKRGPASRNKAMLAAAKTVVKGMTALDAWDYTAYPHEQVMWDNEALLAALGALKAKPVKAAAAIKALTGVGINWYGTVFSPSVLQFDITRRDPDYSRVTWGSLGKLITYYDTTPVMQAVQEGKYDSAKASIESMLKANERDLNKRLKAMTKTFNDGTSILLKAI